jgi:diguanylate cyclase (GGDEF)-like protein/PAS domain S-box-containing protein
MAVTRTQILVVEDENIVAKDIEHRLKALGYHVPALASSGEEALKRAQETSPDLVLMDIRLKGAMDGVQTAEELRRRFNIPVVYLTAYADANTLQRAKVTEPFGYILKPFEERELYTCIEVALYKHQMEQRLKESEQWLVTTLHCIGDAVMATDVAGRVKFLNPVAEELTGWKQADAVEHSFPEVFNILAREDLPEIELDQVLSESQVRDRPNETILMAKTGCATPIEYRAASIRSDSGLGIGMVLVFRDITERKQAEDKLQYLSTHDSLTGLYNRAYFEEELARLERGRHFPVSVIVGDIDRFKTTNDIYGHQAGDKVLRDAAEVIKGAFRAEDVVTRIGGDEFVILLPLTDASATTEAILRIKENLAAYNDAHKEYPLSISFGAATAKKGPLTETLKEADKRMYREKVVNMSRAKH